MIAEYDHLERQVRRLAVTVNERFGDYLKDRHLLGESVDLARAQIGDNLKALGYQSAPRMIERIRAHRSGETDRQSEQEGKCGMHLENLKLGGSDYANGGEF
jgi:hypothetical protein